MVLCYNVKGIDRTFRIVAGVALLAATPVIGYWGCVGLVPLVTGIVGYCPFYSLFSRGS
ncbi:DUF2892 domain-containing protein [Paraburkholderia sp. J41]|uniref:YgaP family membrane protein n=1 Tax=Paraburkholderia sp. J41 TaxID=2805433 RepID=UPI002AC31DD0|nr:DUF2892 domain-containing protein [Paraburkholderia sp. J41]